MANLFKILFLLSLVFLGCNASRISSIARYDASAGGDNGGREGAPTEEDNEKQLKEKNNEKVPNDPEEYEEHIPGFQSQNPQPTPEGDHEEHGGPLSFFPKWKFPFFPFFDDKVKPAPYFPPEDAPKEDIVSTFNGSWEIHSENAGVSAMHMQLMPNNKLVWYDTTNLGLSGIESEPRKCKPRVGGRKNDPKEDCTAHAIEYDIETAKIRTLRVESDPWCSSGGLSPKGELVSTGGNQDGLRGVRIMGHCEKCDFRENDKGMTANRWYATQHTLENGNFIVLGGRAAYNYEIIPSDQLEFPTNMFALPFLEETNEVGENNLYPFVNLLPDGNLFVFANYKSIILNPLTGKTVRHLPDLPGGSRNYPPSAMSALLPINLNEKKPVMEVIVCGGNTRDSYVYSDMKRPRKFFDALKDCGRLNLNKEGSDWVKEDMPSARVMGDMLVLPTGDLLILNGAKAGTSAWNSADVPNFTPLLYSPNKKQGERFKELAPTTIARMYHSVSAVLPDGKILVAGSNTNAYYMFDKARDPMVFPTELRVEKFSPPYLAPELQQQRLNINEEDSDKKLKYGDEFNVSFESDAGEIDQTEIKVTMYSPPFTTHGYSMNQRLLILKLKNVAGGKITVFAPATGNIAPPGYYLLFVVHQEVPSRGMWVHIE